jgi:hypothetical protein
VQEVLRVVLEQDAADCGATVEYSLVLGAGSVSKHMHVLKAPLELVAKCVHAVLNIERVLDE